MEVQFPWGLRCKRLHPPRPPPPQCPPQPPGEALPQEALKEMITKLMNFLLLKYRAKGS